MTETSRSSTPAADLLALHRAPALLTLVNVWDVVSARAVAGVEGTRALATASHSIAASRGYEDGERIPVAEMLEEVRRIVAATDLPVTADLEGGYGDAPETVRRAIGVGVVGANIEDQLRPTAQAAAQVEAVLAAAAAEGVPDFVLNARTDAFLLAGTGTRPSSWRTPWSGAGPTSTPGPRSSSCQASWTRTGSPPSSRPSARGGSAPSPCPGHRRWRARRSSAWPGSPSGRCHSGCR